jgi:LPXTG-site transpeptidase (sortase) family protein
VETGHPTPPATLGEPTPPAVPGELAPPAGAGGDGWGTASGKRRRSLLPPATLGGPTPPAVPGEPAPPAMPGPASFPPAGAGGNGWGTASGKRRRSLLPPPAASGARQTPSPAKRGRSRLPPVAATRRELAPRTSRWWVGAAITVASLLALAFVAHAAVFSGLQHARTQSLAYRDLREALAKAEAPTGQLDLHGELTPLGAPVALLEIPSIGLSEVVREGSTAAVLRGGAGHRRDSVLPGQPGTAVILGRQATYGGPFKNLKSLAPGDQITVTTGQGVATYRVFGLRRAGDPVPEDLPTGQGRLELMTADGLALFPSGVLHVDAELVTGPHPGSSKVMAYAALPASERAMGQDPGAWLTVFFVGTLAAGVVAALIWLWRTWGRRQAWLIGVPVTFALGAALADSIMSALPNLL